MIQIIINVLLILVPQYKWKGIPLLMAAFVSDRWGYFARGYEHDCTRYSLNAEHGTHFFTFLSNKLFSQD